MRHVILKFRHVGDNRDLLIERQARTQEEAGSLFRQLADGCQPGEEVVWTDTRKGERVRTYYERTVEEQLKLLAEAVERWLTGWEKDAEEDLLKFRGQLESDPHYALRWSESAFAAAARRYVVSGLASAWREQRATLPQLTEAARSRMIQGIRGGRSTSPCQNLMAESELHAWADAYERLSFFASRYLELETKVVRS